MLISALLTVIMVLTMGVLPAVANGAEASLSSGVYFLSKEIPESATEFAKSYFSTFTTNMLFESDFTQEEINNLRLAQGITAYEYDECDAPFYYFPVLANGKIIAVLTMADFGDGQYSAQFGKSDFAFSLNDINSEQNKPAVLVITNEAMYALDSSDTLAIIDEFYYWQDESVSNSSKQMRNITEPKIAFEDIRSACDVEVFVGNETVYNVTIQNSLLRNVTVENYLSVPFVSNGTNSRFPEGYCWASSVASLIYYRYNSYVPISATELRDSILSNSSNTGTDSNIKSIIDNHLSVSSTNSSTRPSFSTIKTQIDSGKPIYSHWKPSSGTGHAMVVRGHYKYDAPGVSVEQISLMDPNKTSYQYAYPSGSYVVGTKSMYWQTAVY